MCTMCLSTICTNTNATIYVENGVGVNGVGVNILTGWGSHLITQQWPLQHGLPMQLKFS